MLEATAHSRSRLGNPLHPIVTASGTQTRRLLLVGFGGVLLLLAFTGLNALSVLKNIRTRNDQIRRDYVNR